MFEILFLHIQKKVALSDSDKENIKPYFRTKKLRKRQYLLQESEVCRNLTFISKGLLKSYSTDDKGVEHINIFGFEGWWISDFRSFICGDESVLNIEAIEDSEVLLISRESYEELMLEVPIMERYFRILYQNSLVTKETRLMADHTYNAEEKYRNLLQDFPEIMQRIPQNLLASYLGMTPETLSRIKKRIM